LSKVIFINRYFHPDFSATSEMLSGLAFALEERGLPVAVITGRRGYKDPDVVYPRLEIIDNVEVHRVWTSKLGGTSLLGRILDYISFGFLAGWRLWKLAQPRDVIVAKTDPPLLSLIAAPIARMRGARLVNWLQDVFPETAEKLEVGGRAGGLAFRVLRPLRNLSLHASDLNVAVGGVMADHLIKAGVRPERIAVIQNWSDESVVHPIEPAQNELRRAWVTNDRFVVAYAGNLGRAHELSAIIEAMRLLNQTAASSPGSDVSRRILFLFVGGGVQRENLEREALRQGLTNVQFRPYQPREGLAETLCVADVHLVSLNPKLEGLVVPSKFYAVAAAGRPTIFIGSSDGEIARLLRQFECGFTVAPGDGAVLVNRILQLAGDDRLRRIMGARARAAFEEHWNKQHAVDRWEDVLRKILADTNSDSVRARQAQSV
jgi:glycosyltransferase involved in cell wall biosynthesis